jgi:hypothetical protein
MTKALALWTYQAQEVLHDNKENEISFTAGDHIEIIDLCNTVHDVN